MQQLRGSVGQDKTVPQRVRVATTQPVTEKKDARTHDMKTNGSRTQKRSSSNRKTVHLALWVKPGVKAELERIAANEGLSVSKTGAVFLEKAIQSDIHTQQEALLEPLIEQAIRKQMRGISTRLAWLLVRVAFDTGQTRSLVTNILGRQPGVTPEVLNTILDGSSKTAKANITRRTPQIAELIAAVEHWIAEEEREGEA